MMATTSSFQMLNSLKSVRINRTSPSPIRPLTANTFVSRPNCPSPWSGYFWQSGRSPGCQEKQACGCQDHPIRPEISRRFQDRASRVGYAQGQRRREQESVHSPARLFRLPRPHLHCHGSPGPKRFRLSQRQRLCAFSQQPDPELCQTAIHQRSM